MRRRKKWSNWNTNPDKGCSEIFGAVDPNGKYVGFMPVVVVARSNSRQGEDNFRRDDLRKNYSDSDLFWVSFVEKEERSLVVVVAC
jgi:hypothetical protein